VRLVRLRNLSCSRGSMAPELGSERQRFFRAGRAAGTAIACLGALLAVHGTLLTAGCSHARGPAPFSLLGRFVPSTPGAGGGSLLGPIVVDRAGVKKRAMVLVAPVAATASLGGFSGRIELKFTTVPVFNVGDGIRMEIRVIDDGPPVLVCSRYFDPGRRFEDRRWTPMSVSMDLHSKDPRLEIRVSGGPEGNLTGDWLAFAGLQISSGTERQ
jgi:hypothetical protein